QDGKKMTPRSWGRELSRPCNQSNKTAARTGAFQNYNAGQTMDRQSVDGSRGMQADNKAEANRR
ncbi:MAG TPA: hypothetical protein VGC89_05605, partial [Pyrinomonadaceae bacterium]